MLSVLAVFGVRLLTSLFSQPERPLVRTIRSETGAEAVVKRAALGDARRTSGC